MPKKLKKAKKTVPSKLTIRTLTPSLRKWAEFQIDVVHARKSPNWSKEQQKAVDLIRGQREKQQERAKIKKFQVTTRTISNKTAIKRLQEIVTPDRYQRVATKINTGQRIEFTIKTVNNKNVTKAREKHTAYLFDKGVTVPRIIELKETLKDAITYHYATGKKKEIALDLVKTYSKVENLLNKYQIVDETLLTQIAALQKRLNKFPVNSKLWKETKADINDLTLQHEKLLNDIFLQEQNIYQDKTVLGFNAVERDGDLRTLLLATPYLSQQEIEQGLQRIKDIDNVLFNETKIQTGERDDFDSYTLDRDVEAIRAILERAGCLQNIEDSNPEGAEALAQWLGVTLDNLRKWEASNGSYPLNRALDSAKLLEAQLVKSSAARKGRKQW